ncbi:MAG: hypothetical protein C0507_18675 [Cyanobacteria bacterium PR.3.49]|jgi:uncharacterized surface protein with fasciclin (FAS1) repeats|nr:hypothetical protein [Cyanobacteria bacterium PR.3.49]
MNVRNLVTLGACATVGALSVCSAFSKDLTTSGPMSTASKQDIINTLRSKGNFHKMLSGLEQSYELDNELKGKGPYTVFAADDKAWKKINQADQDTLFGNKKKIDEVLRYGVLKGQNLDSDQLYKMQGKEVQSLEGRLIKVGMTAGEKEQAFLWLNDSKVKTPDIRCRNGIIHIVDAPLMPPLKK